jgi:hypothetical protein
VLFLIVLGFTGAVLNQRGPVLDGIASMEPDKGLQARVPQLSSQGDVWLSWQELLRRAHDSMPNGTLASISIPRNSEVLDFRFRTEMDISQFGASHVYLNPFDGRIEGIYDVNNTSTLRWLFSQFRPLHTGENMPAWYVILICLGSLIGTVVTATGVIAFVRRLREKPAG